MGIESRSSISRLTVTDNAVVVHYIAEVPITRVGFCCLPCVGEEAGTSRGCVAQLGSCAGVLTQAVLLRSQFCLQRHSVITAAQGWGIRTQARQCFTKMPDSCSFLEAFQSHCQSFRARLEGSERQESFKYYGPHMPPFVILYLSARSDGMNSSYETYVSDL